MRVLWSHFSSCVITFNNDSLAITARLSARRPRFYLILPYEALRDADEVYFHDFNVELLQIPARKHIAKRALINDNNSRTGWTLNEFTVAIKWSYNYDFSILFLRHGMTDEILMKLSFEVTIKFLFFFFFFFYIIQSALSILRWSSWFVIYFHYYYLFVNYDYDGLHGLLFIFIIIICLLITIFCFCEDYLELSLAQLNWCY